MDTIPELLQEMHIPSRREAAVQALEAMGPSVVRPLGQELLEGKNPYVRERVAWVLGQVGDTAAIPDLVIGLLRDRDETVREACLLALESIGANDAFMWLLLSLHDGDPLHKERAAAALARLGNATTLKVLRGRLRPLFGERDEEVREAIAAAIVTLEEKVQRRQLPLPADTSHEASASLPLPAAGPEREWAPGTTPRRPTPGTQHRPR
jgi:HEAT repeat protein